jgi:hypothetical protein
MENLDRDFPVWPGVAGVQLDVSAAVNLLNGIYQNEPPDETWPLLSQALVLLRGNAYRQEQQTLIQRLTAGAPHQDQQDLVRTFALRGPDLETGLIEQVGSSPLAIDTDACEFLDVTVRGTPAVYIQSTFTTNVPFATLQGWLDPVNWPERAPLMFDDVQRQSSCTPRFRVGFTISDEVVYERATPTWDVVQNYLVCGRASYGNSFAITSYDLDPNNSQDVLVDNGYLLLADRGNNSTMVGFVKAIGFKHPQENDSVKKLRPFWLTLIRAIAEGDYTTKVQGRRLEGDSPETGAASIPTGELARRWISAASSGVGEFGSFAGSTIERLTGPQFGWNQYRDLLVTYWQRIGEAYADAWRETQTVVGSMGPQDNTSGLPFASLFGTSSRTTSIVPAPNTATSHAIVVSDLVHIADANAPAISRDRIYPQIIAQAGAPALRLDVDSTGARRGVYVGTAIIGSTTVPTYIFVSDAVRAHA